MHCSSSMSRNQLKIFSHVRARMARSHRLSRARVRMQQQQQQEFGAAPSLHEESHVVARNNSVPLSRRDCCDSTAKIWVRAFGDLRMLPLFFEATARWQKCRPSPLLLLLLLLPTPSSPRERYLISKTRGQTNSPHWKTRILKEKLQEKRHGDSEKHALQQAKRTSLPKTPRKKQTVSQSLSKCASPPQSHTKH